MCLHYITTMEAPVSTGYQVKQKNIHGSHGCYGPMYYRGIQNRVACGFFKRLLKRTDLRIGETYKAPKGKIKITHDCTYDKGFHVWHNINDATEYFRQLVRNFYSPDILAIVEVQTLGKKIVGKQNGCNITVARKIKLLREIPREELLI